MGIIAAKQGQFGIHCNCCKVSLGSTYAAADHHLMCKRALQPQQQPNLGWYVIAAVASRAWPPQLTNNVQESTMTTAREHKEAGRHHGASTTEQASQAAVTQPRRDLNLISQATSSACEILPLQNEEHAYI